MSQLLEFVPNFSEGRDAAVVDAIAESMTAVAGARLLAREMDASHHRCVITLAGPAEAMVEAAVAGAREAMARIDLRQHEGEHKRMGAMDVCPFVPLGDTTMRDAVTAARRVGARLGEELQLPVFLYAEAAQRVERKKLGNVRNKQFEGLRELIATDPDYAPDFADSCNFAGRGRRWRAQLPDRLQHQSADRRCPGRQGHRQGRAREGWRPTSRPGDGVLAR